MTSPQPPVSGQTRLAGVIGDPVRHSLSPAIHNAAFAELGLDWMYLAFPVPPGAVPEAMAGMRALGIEGLSVTMPHKDAVAAAVDELTPTAARLGAVNSVFRQGDRLVGDNTDGEGFLDALAAETGFEVSGCRSAIVGAGGAARAVGGALADAGAAEVLVINRSAERAATAVAAIGAGARQGEPAELGSVDLVVNGTPVGMGDDPNLPFPVDLLNNAQVVVDLIYSPARTPLLAAAGARGLTTMNGLGMLVHQAGRQFTRWTGQPAPIGAMEDAVRLRLA
ncbi:MAG: shikimate dehydrogenase [Actinomycetia bacterium]|nr:shikimate dehydrogenase [Actinomycetes bacterium]